MSSKTYRPTTDGNYITVKFGKRTFNILIDSGSAVSLISKKVAHDLKLTITPSINNHQLQLFSANGTKMVIEGTADIRLYLSGLIIMQSVNVCSNV